MRDESLHLSFQYIEAMMPTSGKFSVELSQYTLRGLPDTILADEHSPKADDLVAILPHGHGYGMM